MSITTLQNREKISRFHHNFQLNDAKNIQKIYISFDGNDSNSGLKPDKPLKTFKKAFEIVSLNPPSNEDIASHIAIILNSMGALRTYDLKANEDYDVSDYEYVLNTPYNRLISIWGTPYLNTSEDWDGSVVSSVYTSKFSPARLNYHTLVVTAPVGLAQDAWKGKFISKENGSLANFNNFNFANNLRKTSYIVGNTAEEGGLTTLSLVNKPNDAMGAQTFYIIDLPIITCGQGIEEINDFTWNFNSPFYISGINQENISPVFRAEGMIQGTRFFLKGDSETYTFNTILFTPKIGTDLLLQTTYIEKENPNGDCESGFISYNGIVTFYDTMLEIQDIEQGREEFVPNSLFCIIVNGALWGESSNIKTPYSYETEDLTIQLKMVGCHHFNDFYFEVMGLKNFNFSGGFNHIFLIDSKLYCAQVGSVPAFLAGGQAAVVRSNSQLIFQTGSDCDDLQSMIDDYDCGSIIRANYAALPYVNNVADIEWNGGTPQAHTPELEQCAIYIGNGWLS